MTFRIGDNHKLIINKNEKYNCYDVELVEFSHNYETRFGVERYSKEAIEEEYGIKF